MLYTKDDLGTPSFPWDLKVEQQILIKDTDRSVESHIWQPRHHVGGVTFLLHIGDTYKLHKGVHVWYRKP